MDGVRIDEDVVIPEDELSWRFTTSGGPGGQHANRSATRVELRFDPRSSRVVSAAQAERIVAELAGRMKGGAVVVIVDDTRSQARNRSLARERMGEVLSTALAEPTERKATKPTTSSQKRRIETKRARGRTKELRKKPPIE